jgi:hypothetical protein
MTTGSKFTYTACEVVIFEKVNSVPQGATKTASFHELGDREAVE